MKNFRIFVVGILGLSLFLNFLLFSKLDTIDNKINNISNYQHQVISTVNSQVGNINNTINKIKDEQSWISPIKVETTLSDTDKDKGEINVEWQVKELQENSEILFNYRMGEDKEYKVLKAEDKGNGFFRVRLPIEVNLEPEWHLHIMSENVRETEVIEEKEEIEQMRNRRDFSYFVSVAHEDMIKSSEINNTHIENIGTRYYGYLNVHTDINKNNKYHVSVINDIMPETQISLKEVYLKKYRNGKLINEEELEKESVIYENGEVAREEPSIFNTTSSEEKMDYSKLVLKVVYSDGEVFEREVYSK